MNDGKSVALPTSIGHWGRDDCVLTNIDLKSAEVKYAMYPY